MHHGFGAVNHQGFVSQLRHMLLEGGRVSLDGEAFELPAGHLIIGPEPAPIAFFLFTRINIVSGKQEQTQTTSVLIRKKKFQQMNRISS